MSDTEIQKSIKANVFFGAISQLLRLMNKTEVISVINLNLAISQKSRESNYITPLKHFTLKI